MHDAGDHQAQHIRGIGDQEDRNGQVHQEAAGDYALGGHVHAEDQEDGDHDDRLDQADDRLVGHVG